MSRPPRSATAARYVTLAALAALLWTRACANQPAGDVEQALEQALLEEQRDM